VKKTRIVEQALLDKYEIKTLNKEPCPICGKMLYSDLIIAEIDSHIRDEHPDYGWCNVHQKFEKKNIADRHNTLRVESSGKNKYEILPENDYLYYTVYADTEEEAKRKVEKWIKNETK